MHYGEGGYEETEREIQELLGIERDLSRRCAQRTSRALLLPAQTEDQPGAYSGPYEAGGVWAVLEGAGEVVVGERTIAVSEPGCFELVTHPHHTAGVLDLRVGAGRHCHATCFTPGVAAPRDPARPAAAPAPAARAPR